MKGQLTNLVGGARVKGMNDTGENL